MRFLIGSVVLVLVSVCASAAQNAQDLWNGDGESLLRTCTLYVRVLDGENITTVEMIDASECVGYIRGVHDMEFAMQKLEEMKKVSLMRHSCVPPNVTTGQTVRVVVKYLRDNPERLNMPAAVLAMDAVRTASRLFL